jgi:hypothetical protein
VEAFEGVEADQQTAREQHHVPIEDIPEEPHRDRNPGTESK